MDWFQHDTDSHDDPDISDAEDKFGDAGYSVFFKTLEIYGKEFSHLNNEGWLRISKVFLRRKLRKSWTKVEQILNFYQERERVYTKTENGFILINIPKYLKKASNWTKRIKPKPTEAPTAKEEKKKRIEKKRDIKRFIPPTESEVIKYFVEKGYVASAGKKAFRYYDAANWKDGKGSQVKNWKQKMIGVWFKDENKGTSENTVSEKPICQAGPCQSTTLNKAGYCESCREILSENNCKTYEEFMSQGQKKRSQRQDEGEVLR